PGLRGQPGAPHTRGSQGPARSKSPGCAGVARSRQGPRGTGGPGLRDPGSREGGRPLGAHPPARPARRGGDRGHARRGRPAPGAQLRPGAAVTSPASGTRAAAGSRLPVPTHRALGLLGAGLILALLAGAAPALGRVLVGWNLLVLALLLVDLWRAPRPSSIRAARHLPSPMHLG